MANVTLYVHVYGFPSEMNENLTLNSNKFTSDSELIWWG